MDLIAIEWVKVFFYNKIDKKYNEKGENHMIKAVIFDMDGLMFDSEVLGIEMMKKTMEHFPFEYDHDLNTRIIGTTKEHIRKQFTLQYGDQFPFDEVMQHKKEMTLRYYHENDIPKKSGLMELLQFLKENDYRLGVATSTYRDEAEFMLKKADIYHFFDEIVCGDEVKRSKPNPDIYLTALRKLQVTAEEAIVLEDSENGLRAGQSAGIATIFVKDLVHPHEEVLGKVACSAQSLHDVITYLHK